MRKIFNFKKSRQRIADIFILTLGKRSAGIGIRASKPALAVGALLFVLMLPNCGSSKPIRSADMAGFVVGSTSKQNIVDFYGSPSFFDSENLCYLERGFMTVKQHLYFQFDEKGVLRAKALNDETAKKECEKLIAAFMMSLQPNQANNYGGYGAAGNPQNATGKTCNIDIECGVGYKCKAGICTGGIVREIHGTCVTGNFGKRVCTNTGKACTVDSQCF